MDHAPDFGSELRRLRQAVGWSLAELSRRTNYSKGYLSKIETGRARANPVLAKRCDDILETGGVLRGLLARGARPDRSPRPPSEATTPWGRPSGLPRDTVHLPGRDAEIVEIVESMSDRRVDAPGVVEVCAIVGMAGVGKTALAVRAAHMLRERFPDGCLFIDLHGYADTAMVLPADALDRLLRRLGVPGEAIPLHVDDRTALFRDRVAEQSLLLLLDNAHNAAQILPLLPGTSGCRVLVTSRNELSALEDVHRVRLAPLSHADAVGLLRVLGRIRPGTGGTALDEIAERCGRLPLALRIASAQFRADLDAEMSSPTAQAWKRLADFDDGERSLDGLFDASFRSLTPDLRQTYLLLGLHAGPDFGLGAAAARAGIGRPAARRRMRRLLDAHLLTGRGSGRFQFHDLLRQFARERAAAALPQAERDAALRREATYYLWSLEAADRLITPHRYRIDPVDEDVHVEARVHDEYDEAIEWIVTEQDNLLAVCRASFAAGLDGHCWRLAYALRGFLFVAKTMDVWIETHELALRAARRAGDLDAEAKTLNNLGLALMEIDDRDAAAVHYERARRISRRIGDAYGEHTAVAHLAWVHFSRGDPHKALEESRRALAFVERHGLPRNKAILSRDVALIEIELGRYADAISRLYAALEEFMALGLHVDAAMALNCLGEAHRKLGQPTRARDLLLRAAELGRSCGSRHEEARAHGNLGWIAAHRSDRSRALAHWNIALANYTELCDARRTERVRAWIDAFLTTPADPAMNGRADER
ncbi:helix-turn-helix domain-containing protein [Actinomadura sp. K4S16]|uniref:helix-turn-helix domain-containing protein n=1 Tax=Actinomadura sp. K4S16 TaxID=1316147 RepID=UPI0011ED3575|nr:helix-turn-helix domain-containing protein [Actinomadura sp. K4S16]